MLLKLLNSGLHPRRMRLGLIEAQCNRALERDCPGGIRGVCASASLKPIQYCGQGPSERRIRGVCASASLKPRDRHPRPPAGTRIRGVCASASLKQAAHPRLCEAGPRHPRRMRLGLIEACAGTRRHWDRCGGIRGVCASASLKRHLQAAAVAGRWLASEAYAPRPH